MVAAKDDEAGIAILFVKKWDIEVDTGPPNQFDVYMVPPEYLPKGVTIVGTSDVVAEHTSRPWEAKWPKFDSLIVDADDRIIASVSFNDHDHKECEANSYLIAAAPDLFHACEAALNDRMFKDWPDVATILIAAINKAKGKWR